MGEICACSAPFSRGPCDPGKYPGISKKACESAILDSDRESLNLSKEWVKDMRFRHTKRPGFLLGLTDFCTAGIFFLLYMPFGGLQEELEEILGHKVMPYWKAYLLGIPDLFIYTLVWMARISEELKEKAVSLGLPGPYTSFRHMFLWNTLGLFLFGPAVATHRFFHTLNRIERELNRRERKETGKRHRKGPESPGP